MIVLDTHIWLWWINGDASLLGNTRISQIEKCEFIAVSAISCFEVAWLARHARIELSCDQEEWFEKALSGSGITLLPITPKIACIATNLAEHHSDPQDRIIIATALTHNANLMSSDKKFPLYIELADKLL
ncbi:MAG: type II toxin-antitoxin system VapC family toxin [Methylotenera sp.]|nr:type II toxin-antitoxin system VapC family toxin [Methylotenera sp.]